MTLDSYRRDGARRGRTGPGGSRGRASYHLGSERQESTRTRARVRSGGVRKWTWATLLVLGLLGGVGFALVRPAIRSAAVSLAEREGLVLRFSEMELSASSVTLKDVRLSPKTSGFLDARFDRVRVGLGWSAPRLRSLWVEGGRVVLRGSIDEVQEGYRALRGSRASSPAASGGAGGRFVRVHNVKLLWHDAFEPGVAQELTGLELERGPGGQRVGADRVELRAGSTRLQVAGLLLGFSEDRARILALSASEAKVIYELGEQEQSGGSKDADKPRDPKFAAPPNGKTPETGILKRFRLRPELPKQVALALQAVRSQALPRLPERASVERLWVTVHRGLERLEVGPGRLSAEKKDAALNFSFSPGKDAKGTPLSVELEVPLRAGEISAKIAGGPITFRDLGLEEGAFGVRGVHSTELTGKVQGKLGADALLVSGTLELERLQLEDPRIAPEPLQFPRLSWGGELLMRLDGSEFSIKDGEMRLGEARVLSQISFQRDAEAAQLALKLTIPQVACSSLLGAAPPGLLGSAREIGMSGTFALDTEAHLDTAKPSKMDVAFRLENNCRIERVPATLAPEQFRKPFTRTVPGPEALPMLVESGPGSASWTPYESISPYFETALLVTEDGRFFHHRGFDPRAIESSIRDNVVSGAFVRGASTISMQLAKNLYLGREKVLARKGREALLTMVLEQAFDKRKLLELYMNVVELGPGVYGVKSAASYYFNTTPDRLTIAQCFFLASLLPSPKKQHFEADGRISKARRAYLEKLMRIAHDRDRLSSTELERALAEELVLGRPDTGGTPGEPESSPEDTL